MRRVSEFPDSPGSIYIICWVNDQIGLFKRDGGGELNSHEILELEIDTDQDGDGLSNIAETSVYSTDLLDHRQRWCE